MADGSRRMAEMGGRCRCRKVTDRNEGSLEGCNSAQAERTGCTERFLVWRKMNRCRLDAILRWKNKAISRTSYLPLCKDEKVWLGSWRSCW